MHCFHLGHFWKLQFSLLTYSYIMCCHLARGLLDLLLLAFWTNCRASRILGGSILVSTMPVGPCAASRAWAEARSSETSVAEPCLALTSQGLSSKMGTPAAPLRCSEHRQLRWALSPGQQVQCLATEWAAAPHGQEAVRWWRNWRYRLARGTVHL